MLKAILSFVENNPRIVAVLLLRLYNQYNRVSNSGVTPEEMTGGVGGAPWETLMIAKEIWDVFRNYKNIPTIDTL